MELRLRSGESEWSGDREGGVFLEPWCPRLWAS
jgi:hypothetical protein